MKKYWVDFSGWGSVHAESKEEAADKFWQWVDQFWQWVKSNPDDYGFTLAELDKESVEED